MSPGTATQPSEEKAGPDTAGTEVLVLEAGAQRAGGTPWSGRDIAGP